MSFVFPLPNGTAMGQPVSIVDAPKPETESATCTTPRTVASIDDANEESDEDAMPWDDYDWLPVTSTGKQKSPNQIRNELQRYLDSCGRTQGAVIADLGVNNNSFRKFMNPKTYKDPWSAVQNGTYIKAARFLAQHNHNMKLKKQQEQKENKKRKGSSVAATGPEPANKKVKSAKTSRAEAEEWMLGVIATEANTDKVYDSCPEVVKKIKDCLNDTPGLTKASFCKIALGGCNNNALGKFLAAKKQDQQGNAVYPKAYAFFEKLRIKNGEAKSKARIKNEAEKGDKGFGTHTIRTHSYYICAR